MLVTIKILSAITTPELAEKWVIPLNETCERFAIDSPFRIAGFLSNTAHESGGFKFVKENLNYSAASLMRVWPNRFPTLEIAQRYAMQPEKIANRAYADRMGNGSEESGDGAKFLGRGLIQLTGKSNYQAFATDMNLQLEEVIDWCAEPEGACWSAGWYWDSRELNPWADKGDVLTVTKKINGGTIGLKDREEHYAAALEIFK